MNGPKPLDRARALVDGLFARHALDDATSPLLKAQLRSLQTQYASLSGPLPSIWDVGFRVLSEDDEDGVILYILARGGIGTRRFVDIGAGDGIFASNTANLALNLGFDGVFVEADGDRVAAGRAIYERHRDTRRRPPRFVQSFAKTSNIDATIRNAGIEGDIDVLSIDIDGNDYWIWEAISVVSPRIVVIETHDEHGLEDVLAPYDENLVWTDVPEGEPLGASPVAMTKLAERLGYRLVGGNRRGFNAIYAREGFAPEVRPIEVSELLPSTRYAAGEAG